MLMVDDAIVVILCVISMPYQDELISLCFQIVWEATSTRSSVEAKLPPQEYLGTLRCYVLTRCEYKIFERKVLGKGKGVRGRWWGSDRSERELERMSRLRRLGTWYSEADLHMLVIVVSFLVTTMVTILPIKQSPFCAGCDHREGSQSGGSPTITQVTKQPGVIITIVIMITSIVTLGSLSTASAI